MWDLYNRKMKFCGPALFFVFAFPCFSAQAAIDIPITVNLSENVTIAGTPRIAVDVGGTTRYATYTSGTGTNTLTFTLSPQAGDVDLDGVTVSSPIDLNGGTIKDSKGNDAALTFTPPSTSNVKVNYPSLGMDFIYDADGRYTLNGTVYNDLTSFLSAAGGTYTRASIGTYFDSTGTLQTATSGTPRFDYDPITHAAKGILIEESRTNLAKNSENISAWNNNTSLTITSDAVTAPNGTMTADTTNSVGSTRYTVASVTSGTKYTYSFFVKPTDITRQIFLYVDGAAGTGYCRIVPSTGVVSSTSGTYNSAGIISIGNGWYRAYMVFTPTTTGNQAVHIYPLNSDVHAWWGAQLEAGAFPTSYIATTSASVTRDQDKLTIPTGGWYSATQSTLLSTFKVYDTYSTTRAWSSLGQAGTTGERATLYISGTQAYIQNYIGSVSQANQSIGTFSAGVNKIGFALQDNNMAYSLNGNAPTLNTSAIIGTKTILQIGRVVDYSLQMANGPVQGFKYYPSRINNTQLQLLTQ